MPFTGGASNIPSARVDQNESRPGLHSESTPQHLICVIDDRMLDAIFANFLADVVCVLFGVELCRVNADHHEFIGVLLFEKFEVGKYMVAIDATIGPEIEQDDLAAQVVQMDRS